MYWDTLYKFQNCAESHYVAVSLQIPSNPPLVVVLEGC